MKTTSPWKKTNSRSTRGPVHLVLHAYDLERCRGWTGKFDKHVLIVVSEESRCVAIPCRSRNGADRETGTWLCPELGFRGHVPGRQTAALYLVLRQRVGPGTKRHTLCETKPNISVLRAPGPAKVANPAPLQHSQGAPPGVVLQGHSKESSGVQERHAGGESAKTKKDASRGTTLCQSTKKPLNTAKDSNDGTT